MKKRKIYKVQRPLFDSDGSHDKILVYSKDRRDVTEMKPFEELGEELKSFWSGRLVNGQLIDRERAPWQDW